MRISNALSVGSLLFAILAGCSGSSESATSDGPSGTIKGVVIYTGPPPCTENGGIVGDAVLNVYDVNALPAPDGIGLAPSQVAVVPGDVLFAGVKANLPYNADGSRACSELDAAPVEVSAVWQAAVDPGVYQTRAFFDFDGNWLRGRGITDKPTKGDITGGAIDDVAQAIAGGPMVYSNIEVGRVREGVTVHLFRPTPLNRPYFYVSAMRAGGDENGPPQPISPVASGDLLMPSDYRPFNASAISVGDSLYWLRLQSGLPGNESDVAQSSYRIPLGDPFWMQRYDTNRDGVIDQLDHIRGTTLPVTAIGPMASLDKLDKRAGIDTQDAPRVSVDLVVLPEGMDQLIQLLETSDYDDPVSHQSLTALVRPTVVCIENPADVNSKTVIVAPHVTDLQDPANQVVADEHAMRKDTAEQLGRNIANVELVYGCLVPGSYGLRLTYPQTGQAWSVPNEFGVCASGESQGQDTCGSRPRFDSQSQTFEIGVAQDPAYCRAQRKPLDEPDPIRDYCLTESERTMYIDGTLWGGDPVPL